MYLRLFIVSPEDTHLRRIVAHKLELRIIAMTHTWADLHCVSKNVTLLVIR